MQYDKLLEPGKIGTMDVRNRIVMPGMGTNFGTEEGFVTDRCIAYYEARAKGGVGVIVVELTGVDMATGRIQIRQLSLDDDKYIPDMKRLTTVIQKAGAKAAVHLHHAGRAAREQFVPVLMGPSPIPFPSRTVPREMTKEDIDGVVKNFGQAARRAKEAGFDAIEVQGGHKYLMAQFLSSASNQRTDEYGGSLENKARLLMEVIAAVRDAVGREYPFWIRLNGQEFEEPNGITIEESKQVSKWIEKAGVDAIHVSGQGAYPDQAAHGPITHFYDHLVPLAAAIKDVVNIPIMSVGKIVPEHGEMILRKGQADFIVMGRPIIADPDFPNKLKDGKVDEIRRCIFCSACADNVAGKLDGMACTVNAAAGHEHEFKFERAKESKNVMIVGGGPGGLEAARTAAERGHKVTIFEKTDRLGGGLKIVSILKSEVAVFLNYLKDKVEKNNINVIYGQEIDKKQIEVINPDVIVLAVGSKLVSPPIPGIEKDLVITGNAVRDMMQGNYKFDGSEKGAGLQKVLWSVGSFVIRTFPNPSLIRQLSRIWMPFGQKVVIIGGDRIGCETAEFLVERGKKVTIVDTQEGIMGDGIAYSIRYYTLQRIEQMGGVMHSGVKYEEVTDKGLVITTEDGQRKLIEADTIIVAANPQPNNALESDLGDIKADHYLIGDCNQPRGILEAIAEGSKVGRSI